MQGCKQLYMLEVLHIDKNMPNANPLLFSIGFTRMFKHCHIPQYMINSVIIPLIKNKCGYQTDKNNYRQIALSSIVSKVFEVIIAERLEVYLWTNHN